MAFCVWLLPLGMMFSGFIQVTVCVNPSFLQQNIFHCMDTDILLVRSLVDEHWDDFHFLAIMNNTAVSICAHVFCGTACFSSLGLYPGVEMVASHGILFKL